MIGAEILVGGSAQGNALVLDAPISFWGGVNPKTALVTLAGHPQEGVSVADRVLLIPRLIGSSSSSAVMLELLHAECAPAGIVLGESDAILALGVMVAREMSWPTVPVLKTDVAPFKTGQWLNLAEDGAITVHASPN